MNKVALHTEMAIASLSTVMALAEPEKTLLTMPQVECPVVHHFGPNLCAREVFMAAGTLAIGHKQKFEHMNVMLKGAVMILDDNGNPSILRAPMMFVGKPGRKIGYVLEDMVWQNIYSTDLKNPDEVEEYFIEKSDEWKEDHAIKFKVESISREADRFDYFLALEQFGIDHDVARAQAENNIDMVWVNNPIVRVSESPIEGDGLYVTSFVKEGDIICEARVDGYRTQAGRYTNHSTHPNCKMVMRSNGDIDLMATEDIQGCVGGNLGTEVTIDYRQALTLLGLKRRRISCQE